MADEDKKNNVDEEEQDLEKEEEKKDEDKKDDKEDKKASKEVSFTDSPIFKELKNIEERIIKNVEDKLKEMKKEINETPMRKALASNVSDTVEKQVEKFDGSFADFYKKAKRIN